MFCFNTEKVIFLYEILILRRGLSLDLTPGLQCHSPALSNGSCFTMKTLYYIYL